MQIKQLSDSVLELSGDNAKVNFIYKGKPSDLEAINIGFVENEGVVSRPGEYELSDIPIIALETKNNPVGVADVFAINVEGVNFLFVGTEKYSLVKEQRDLVGKVDVLVINLSDRENAEGIVNKVDPAAVVAINFETPEQAAKETQLTATDAEKKFKFTSDDFIEEEASVILHLLTR